MTNRNLSAALLLCLLRAPAITIAQAPPAPATPITLDRIVLRLDRSGHQDVSVHSGPDLYEATNMPLRQLIAEAYNIPAWLVSDLPPWADDAHYDIQARTPPIGDLAATRIPPAQESAMVRTILRDRFGLVAHSDTKEVPVYELTLAPGNTGSRLHEVPPSARAPAPIDRTSNLDMADGKIVATATRMQTLAGNLSYALQRSVLDRTGLTGEYTFQLTWTPHETPRSARGRHVPEPLPALAGALERQLGLRLRPARAAVPTLTVDHITPPRLD